MSCLGHSQGHRRCGARSGDTMTDPAPPSEPVANRRHAMGHCCFTGCRMVHCGFCREERCMYDRHLCEPEPPPSGPCAVAGCGREASTTVLVEGIEGQALDDPIPVRVCSDCIDTYGLTGGSDATS